VNLFDFDPDTKRAAPSEFVPIWHRILAVSADQDAGDILEDPTDHGCVQCGKEYLKRFEVLNGNRCEGCRLKYVYAMERAEGAVLSCPMPDGEWCSGYHHGEGAKATKRCPRSLAREGAKS
jgi:DNA-directed RNA polymerase subunit RPC12/RpoP